MIPYWLLFSFFALGSLQETGRRSGDFRAYPLMILGGVLLALLIGFRYEVGGDWGTYEFMFEYARHISLERALEVGDPGYQFVNWSVQSVGGALWLVNLTCGAIFAWGLVRFSQVQPNAWLAVSVAIPYMAVVVAMGYSRQGVALGILMAGLASLKRDWSLVRFFIYVAAAALFHKTAVVAFPLVALATPRNRLTNIFIAIATSVVLYDLFLGDAMEQFVRNYVRAEYSSQGAAIRVAMNLIPAAIFLIYGRRLEFSLEELSLWRNFSWAAFGFLILFLILPSSTVVDRLSLYIMPLQLVILCRLPGALLTPMLGKVLVISYSSAVLFVWLNFATHSVFWLPYRFYPLGTD